MKTFTEIREARRSAQDRLSARAAKHGLGSQKRLDKIKKASDFFSKPPPSFSKDELKKMGYAVESSKVPAGMKFIASYVYKDANGKDHTHRHLRKGSKMNDPVVVYIDDKEWKTFQSFTKAKQAAINHIKGMKESIDEASSPEQQAAIAIAKKADKVVNEDVNVKSIDIFKAAAKDFAKNKDINFQSIADALSTIATMVRSLSMSKSGRSDYKFEQIINKQEVRINNIINKTMYGKGGATPEGREIKKILSKHGLDRTFNGLIFNSVDEAYYRGQRKATPKKQEPPKMGSKSGSGYDLYHKSYSGALQHAYAWAKKQGHIVDPDDIDSKVASGPKKPSEGRTNSFTLKLKDNPRKMLAVQVYGMGGGKYELNTYIT